jgi:hypothetical protein
MVLERLYDRYRQAAERGRRPRPSLEDVDALLTARVVLFEHLLRTGWEPPPPARRQLALDAVLLEQPPTLVDG